MQTDNKETSKFQLEKPTLKKELPEDVIQYLREKYPPRINGAGIEQHDDVNYITEELSFMDDVNINNCIMKYGVAPLGVLWFLRLRMANTLGWGLDVTGKEYQRLLNDMTLDLNMTYEDFQYLSNALIECGIVKVVYGSDQHIYWTTMQQFYNFEYKSFRAYVKAYKEENGIVGRFNIDTTCDRNATKVLSCFVMSASSDLISSMTRKEQIAYFHCGLAFLKTEYPTFHVVDCRIHYDEKGLPHMHASMLPIHEKENGTKTFNVSQHQKGKDYFRGFQDRFYEYMKERYPDKDLQRTNPERDHDKKMTVKEYKENQDMKRELEQERLYLLERAERLKEIEKQIDDRFQEAEEIRAYNDEIDRYCREQGLSYYQYEKTMLLGG